MGTTTKQAGGESRPAPTLTLQQSGRVIPLKAPDMYQLVISDVAIPNQALEDILALWHYGSLQLIEDNESILSRMKRLTAADFELARLCFDGVDLVLEGDAAPGDLTPADLTRGDLASVRTFFLTGRAPALPDTADTEPGEAADPDRPGGADAHNAG